MLLGLLQLRGALANSLVGPGAVGSYQGGGGGRRFGGLLGAMCLGSKIEGARTLASTCPFASLALCLIYEVSDIDRC